MSSSIAGVTDIELVPVFEDRAVAARLQTLLGQCTSLRAAVAYWCVGSKELGPDLVPRLSGDGFLCVDIHLPTDIDRLSQMVSAGANVYLYLLNPNPQPGELKARIPPHLLHPKMLLFDNPAQPSELWVGSHNWTARSLTGVNVEASVRVRLARDSGLYQDAATFLEGVRLSCTPFDPTAVAYYKWLQGMEVEESIWVLELRGPRTALDLHRRLTVFGRTEEDYRNLKSVDMNIVISLVDPNATTEILYEAAISDTGRLSNAGVTFDSRIYAAHDGSPRPELQGPEVPPASVRNAASSWAIVALVDELVGASYEIPPSERWLPADDDAAPRSIVHDLRKWFPQPERPLVQRPVPRAVFERRESLEGEAAFMLPSSSATLIRRKLVRAKRLNGQDFAITKRRPLRAKE